MNVALAPAHLDLELLEPLLRDFVRLIGLQATMAIVDKWGGTRLAIAIKADENAELAELIGVELAAVLGRNYGTERPLVPKAGLALRELRNRRIRAEHGIKSARQLALEHKLGERRVWQIIGEPVEPGLFD